ncbi:hypothetical protein GCM10009858_19380 [Terrabacter carboxydivorans]|uniref:Lipoprotein n=2 Tax=Terrabacter carboxydivorans TaxID=619730 RepID=A0ABN3LCL5_9MICO
MVGTAVAAGLLAGCTAGATTAPPDGPGPTPSTAAATPGDPATTLACDAAPKALVDRAAASIAAHPGTITASTYVFAATTATGDWYVLGVDRTYVHDDGTPASGPEGDHSRSLALTNLAPKTGENVAMIPLSVAVSDKTPVSWELVSWTGDTLAAGRRAADRAMACLDAQRQA